MPWHVGGKNALPCSCCNAKCPLIAPRGSWFDSSSWNAPGWTFTENLISGTGAAESIVAPGADSPNQRFGVTFLGSPDDDATFPVGTWIEIRLMSGGADPVWARFTRVQQATFRVTFGVGGATSGDTGELLFGGAWGNASLVLCYQDGKASVEWATTVNGAPLGSGKFFADAGDNGDRTVAFETSGPINGVTAIEWVYTLAVDRESCPDCPVPGVDPTPCVQCINGVAATHYRIDWFGQVGVCGLLGCGTGDSANQFGIVSLDDMACQWTCAEGIPFNIIYQLYAFAFFWRLDVGYAGNASARYESQQFPGPMDCLGATAVPMPLVSFSDGFNDCQFGASSVTLTAIPNPGGGGGAVAAGPNQGRSRGLGDTVAKVSRSIGIEPCNGCDERRRWLNNAVPYQP